MRRDECFFDIEFTNTKIYFIFSDKQNIYVFLYTKKTEEFLLFILDKFFTIEQSKPPAATPGVVFCLP